MNDDRGRQENVPHIQYWAVETSPRKYWRTHHFRRWNQMIRDTFDFFVCLFFCFVVLIGKEYMLCHC